MKLKRITSGDKLFKKLFKENEKDEYLPKNFTLHMTQNKKIDELIERVNQIVKMLNEQTNTTKTNTKKLQNKRSNTK